MPFNTASLESMDFTFDLIENLHKKSVQEITKIL